ncbi:fasciclin domain-containing protein [Ulvibacter litoralis]|uniref:Fasciclin domain-containing protein n=1 Tax=Ulvibacter litoralis TaxID=227084 RepID=A0A1G7GKF9_9FLAO|nr:fasciclin domain-containing protein [Ulvibacter litoralis]GHC55837.1 hypothetical protein GCM10008083_20290 [Ulvibacter litoralis]SDE88616.1 Fasciclin domain-containing protein [Ulvibacter litoralis]
MKLIYRTLFLLGLTIVTFSCKNEVKNTSVEAETIVAKKNESTSQKKKDLSEEDKNQVNSVLMKAMVTPELKSFVSLMVSAGVTDMLAKNKGPFTIFAPSNDALKAMGDEAMKSLLNPENKETLAAFVNAHIIKADLKSTNLVQEIKSAKGNYALTTLSGETITASREGTKIVLSSAAGKKATLGKSDIVGGNGVLHVLDNVLSSK